MSSWKVFPRIDCEVMCEREALLLINDYSFAVSDETFNSASSDNYHLQLRAADTTRTQTTRSRLRVQPNVSSLMEMTAMITSRRKRAWRLMDSGTNVCGGR